ncbi:hypothetical protein [Magnetospirillum molischianum]|uniref:hypothetical protein n=1 Tax=Magnetospirillum molischianum TaxID=1083 RepID=UPI0002ED9D43|nr:hypothetical protein [Magnetospirillum molischianum]
MAKKKKKSKKNKYGKRGLPVGNPQAGTGGLFAGLGRMLPAGRTEQFLLGAAIGAAAAYVLSDEELRGKLIRSGVKLYSGLVGGLEEVKEQVADIQAELQAEQSGAA